MRKFGVLLAAGLLMFSVVSCSTKKNEDVSAESPSTRAQSSDDAETSTTKKSTSTTDDSGSSDGTSLLDNIETCGAVSALTVTLGLGAAFLNDEQQAELENELDDLGGKVPDEIRDDIETLQNGAADAEGLSELGAFFESDEYREATENITNYLTENCGAGN